MFTLDERDAHLRLISGILQDNHGNRITEALACGIVQMLQARIPAYDPAMLQAPPLPAADPAPAAGAGQPVGDGAGLASAFNIVPASVGAAQALPSVEGAS